MPSKPNCITTFKIEMPEKHNFWVGTRETGLYLYDGKTFTKFSE